MKYIYSTIDSNKLLHIIHRYDDVVDRKEQRVDIIDEKNFIQCSSLKLQKGTTFKAHKHIWKQKNQNIIAQESWIVIRGSVECFFYDTDNTLLEKVIINAGDASFTLEGGHNYLALEDDTIVMEYKTGPYEGQANDKVFI